MMETLSIHPSSKATIFMPPKDMSRAFEQSITVPIGESLSHAFVDAAIFVHIARFLGSCDQPCLIFRQPEVHPR
jgi:hypothetical protein